ncbi:MULTISPECIES: SLC13 family permease [unclassified Pseudonocardia]|uniref:SLC13 family permease n=1 Tax=unclassified Pseudonocardia TaxID=2619320 RepID=UPI0001FFF205|nr:SLC13 family permease [Pseudonocardia sp. Ae707_Ps1]OLM17021.1 Dicarboxylate carrier protein [Pseudonocardia sp. Ae707_Ps1]
MGPEIVSIVVLVVMFVIATTMPVNLGALALVAAVGVGVGMLGLSLDEVILGVPDGDEIAGGFPGDLFLLLVGLTYLFALATANGTVDLIVHGAMRLVRGRLALAPFVFFAISCGLSALGALFAVAIVAPLALPFARRYGVNLLLMGMMVVHGALGGAFSPITVYGAFVNSTMARVGLPGDPVVLFLTPLVVNVVIAVGIYLLLGGRSLLGRSVDQEVTESGDLPDLRIGPERGVTLAGIVLMAVGAAAFGWDVGVVALAVAIVLRLMNPKRPDVVGQVSWSTVLLICGVITYVGVLIAAGTVDFVSSGITAIGAPLLAALLLCYLGGVLSAFASSVAILGVAIPLAVPFLQQGQVSAIGMVAALAVAATVVDVSPFSTNGALVLANAPAGVDRDAFYRQMMVYAGVVVVVGPLLAWALLVLPGLL